MSHVAIHLYEDGSVEYWVYHNGVGHDVTDARHQRREIARRVREATARETDDSLIG